MRVLDGIVTVFTRVGWTLTTDSTTRDWLAVLLLGSIAAIGWYYLYWPALRPPKGRHRLSLPVHPMNGTVPEGEIA